jgi:peptidoglycan-N-acetylglucosamine deacetylase
MYFFRPTQLQKMLFNKCVWSKKTEEKSIYLTFDDGPTEEVTEYVLDQLASYNAKATFFVIGQNVEANPKIIEKVIVAGHAIGNHTQHHLSGWSVNLPEYLNEMNQCDMVLKDRGITTNLFRPPYGRLTFAQAQALYRSKQVVMWSLLSGDFDEGLDIEKSLSVLKRAQSGDIIVFHDSQKAFSQMKVLLPPILAFYAENGFVFKKL